MSRALVIGGVVVGVFFSIEAVAIGILVAYLLNTAYFNYYLCTILGQSFGKYLQFVFLYFILLVMSILLTLGIAGYLFVQGTFISILFKPVLFVAIYFCLIWSFDATTLKAIVKEVKSYLKK